MAIIGIGCRFPGGASDADAYWRLIEQCSDGVRDVPPGRWSEELLDADPRTPGTSYAMRGGYLDDPGKEFDAGFFGISPREAETLDPQQRLLLEVGYEALEDAGLRLQDVRGSSTGVFVGGFTLDNMLLRFADLTAVDAHTATSSSMTVLSNRLSYTFDLRGPSMTLDTACSSSLVATHLACRAIEAGDCDQALVGGVNVMLLPNFQVVMCKGRFLAADGRSKAFDAAADGYGRGEGAGMVLVKPLDRALADGDRIYAVIRGTGVNQDGTTDGMPQPSGEAQEALLRKVCAASDIDPASVGYIEAHGTGTALGDPIEVGALGRVYGRPGAIDAPRLGSVKPNIGHQEAAAGIAGLIKAALAVHHAVRPPHWRPEHLNPALGLDKAGLVLPHVAERWDAGVRRAAVNSFGYGGTNAHAVLEQAPSNKAPSTDRTTHVVRMVPVSGKGDDALRARASQLSDALPSVGLSELAGTLAHHRSHLSTRAVVVSDEGAVVDEALQALAEGRTHDAVVGPQPRSEKVAWLFTGMGPQWWAMGQELYATDATFRCALEAACVELARFGCDIRPELFLDRETSRMPRNDVAQPANFVVQVALATTLRARGLEPDVVLGHSTGEMAAAWCAGSLSLRDAACVVAARSRLQQEVAGGGMLAVALSAEDVQEAWEGIEGVLEIAAYNADTSVVVAGDIPALEALAVRLETEGTWCARVRVEVGYHCAHMNPIGMRLLEALDDITPRAPRIPLVSTVTGEQVTDAVHDGSYWWRNTRGAVRLADGVRAALELGVDTVLEVGPHPVLGSSVQAVGGSRVSTLHAMRRRSDEVDTLRRAVAELYVRGADVAPEAFADEARADLPAYPWQRRVLWREPESVRAARLGVVDGHPFLRRQAAEQGTGRTAWTARLDRSPLSWLRDHVVQGSTIVPGAAYLEAARAAVARTSDETTVVLSEITIDRALALPDAGEAVWLRTEVDDGRVRVQSRTGSRGDAVTHATARIEETRRWKALGAHPVAAVRARCEDAVDVAELYETLARRGLQYGPAFQGLKQLWRCAGEVLAELDVDAAPGGGFVLHPSLLDASFQALLGAVDYGRTLVPVGAERLQVADARPRRLWVHGRVRADEGDAIVGDLWLVDGEDRCVARVVGLRCQALAQAVGSVDWWHELAWTEAEEAPAYDGPERVVWHAPDGTDPVGRDRLGALLDVIRECAERGVPLDVCTRGAVCVDGTGGDPALAALWGLARVARVEHPVLDLRLFDLDPRGDDVQAVVAALSAGDGEEEVAVRGDTRLVARMQRRPPVDPGADPEALGVVSMPVDTQPTRLVVTRPGHLDSLVFEPCERPAPAADQIEVAVEAGSLNFKDVMKAMGMLDDTALEATYLGTDLGMEAVGRVARVGDSVTPDGVRPGQRVLVYKGGTLRSHVVMDPRFAVPCPEDWTVEQAASFFVTCTAWHALVDVARVRAGETVLVQSAAGGVGLAAVHICRHLGAKVIATAGTPEKRAFLRDLGIDRVLDSRTLDFGEEVPVLTGGRGVDVVLNSLGGRAIDVGLDCLAPGGRFVELGKRDLAEGRPVALRAFNRRCAFLAVDLDRAATEDPDYFPPLAARVRDALAAGELPFLPADRFAGGEVEQAFRALGSGNQIGKVVLDLSDGDLPVATGLRSDFAPRAGRSWLVTGGLGGFGLATAAWLAERGVTHLVLASRRGRARGTDAAIVDRLSERVSVEQVALDVTDADAVCALVHRLESSDAPLGGVVHAAALLDDKPLSALTDAALDRVLDAKARGGWHLHRATETCDLEAFVVYSSISAQVGNPGQGAYAAANVALEGLAAHRRARGLPATAVSWGVLGEVGMVARDAATGAHLRSVGLTPMPPVAALDALGTALAEDRPAVGLVDIDWTTWARAHGDSAWSRLAEVTDGDTTVAAGLVGELSALPIEARLDHAVAVLAAAAAPVFGLDTDQLDATAPLRDLGLDSLMAVELASALARAASIEVSAMDLLGGRSIAAVAERVVAATSSTPVPGPQVEGPRAEEAVERLRDRVLLTTPYDVLEDLRVDDDGETLHAEVCPDVLDGEAVPVAAAEAGRHLAILGSLAAVRHNPDPARHEYAVAKAELVLDEVDGPPAERVRLQARCTGFDRASGRATATGALYDLEGRRLATLAVTYHVLPVTTLRALFGAHQRDTVEGPGVDSPYGTWTPAPVLERATDRVVTGLDAVPVEACAGHFPGLPALPVSILGRHVFAAVREAIGTDVRVTRAHLKTERWVWADEPVRFVARPDGSCEVIADGELAARFDLRCAPMRAPAHSRASRASESRDNEGPTVADPLSDLACA